MKKYLLLAILLLIPRPSFATFTRVQTAGNTTSGNPVTLPTSVVAGHLLVITATTYANPTTGMSGNSNSYIHATSSQAYNAALTVYVDTWYVLSANAGSTTITPTTTASFYYIIAREYSYTGSSLAFDVATSGIDSGSAVFASTLSITTASNHELVVACVGAYAGTVTAGPSGWADFVAAGIADSNGSGNLADAPTGVNAANFSFSLGSNWAESIVAFRDTTGGGSPDTLSFASQPTNTVTGTTFSPTVVVNLNLAAGGIDTGSSASVALTINGCGTALSGTTTRTASAGVVTFTALGVTTAATTCNVTASSTGVTSVVSSSFDVTPTGGGGTGIIYIGACVNATTGALTCTPSASTNGLTFLFANFTVTATQNGNWTEISTWAHYSAGAQAPMRLAVYRASDGRLEAQGNATVLVAGGPSWQGHMGAGAITQYHAAVNGTSYKLGFTIDSACACSLDQAVDPAGSSGDVNYSSTAYYATGAGWPTTAPTLPNPAGRVLIRAVIDNSGGGATDNLARQLSTLGVGR